MLNTYFFLRGAVGGVGDVSINIFEGGTREKTSPVSADPACRGTRWSRHLSAIGLGLRYSYHFHRFDLVGMYDRRRVLADLLLQLLLPTAVSFAARIDEAEDAAATLSKMGNEEFCFCILLIRRHSSRGTDFLKSPKGDKQAASTQSILAKLSTYTALDEAGNIGHLTAT